MIYFLIKAETTSDTKLYVPYKYQNSQYNVYLPAAYKIFLNSKDPKGDYVFFQSKSGDPKSDKKQHTESFFMIVNRVMLFLQRKLTKDFQIYYVNPLSFNVFRFLYATLDKYIEKHKNAEAPKEFDLWHCYLVVKNKRHNFFIFNPYKNDSQLFSAVNCKISDALFNTESLANFYQMNKIPTKQKNLTFLALNNITYGTNQKAIRKKCSRIYYLEQLYHYCQQISEEFIYQFTGNMTDERNKLYLYNIRNYIAFVLREYFAELILIELMSLNQTSQNNTIQKLKTNSNLNSEFCDIVCFHTYKAIQKRFDVGNLSVLSCSSPNEILNDILKHSKNKINLSRNIEGLKIHKIENINHVRAGLYHHALADIQKAQKYKLFSSFFIPTYDPKIPVIDLLLDLIEIPDLKNLKLEDFADQKILTIVTLRNIYWIDIETARIDDLHHKLKLNLLILDEIYKILKSKKILNKSLNSLNQPIANLFKNSNFQNSIIRDLSTLKNLPLDQALKSEDFLIECFARSFVDLDKSYNLIITYLFRQNFLVYIKKLLFIQDTQKYTMEKFE